MDKERVLKAFIELAKIDSPSWAEGRIAAHLEQELQVMGFTVGFDGSAEAVGSDTGNLIARLPGTAPGRIMLAAHMDNVEPCEGIEPVVGDDGVVRSQGDTVLGADDKAGVAAILEAVRSVLEAGRPRPEIHVLFTTCEEQSLLGAKALPDGVFEGDIPCFVLDADGAPGTLVIGAPYHYSFQATFTGKAAHAGVEPEAGRSAIQMAACAIAAMELGRLDGDTTANVGMVEGGRAVNIVPDLCTVSGECRSLYADKAEALRARITQALEEGAQRFGGAADVQWELDYPGILYSDDDPLVAKAAEVAQAVGLVPRLVFSGGGADTNVLATKGTRPLTLGIGMKDFHSLTEHIAVKDLEDTARFAEALIGAFADPS